VRQYLIGLCQARLRGTLVVLREITFKSTRRYALVSCFHLDEELHLRLRCRLAGTRRRREPRTTCRWVRLTCRRCRNCERDT